VIPLAGFMGEATEHLAARSGPGIGGLLNATFGNAAELIIALVALRSGLTELVKASITGSILGNLLLIMGLCFVAGGVSRPTLRFNRVSAGASAGMMALAVVGLVFPALFHSIRPTAGFGRELMLSEAVALVLAITYGFSLLFSLKTHHSLFGGEPHPTTGAVWRPLKAIIVLALATAGVVVQSEILVHAVEAVTSTMGFSETFLGLIIVPIIGNAAEHGTAVLVARKGQMDLAMQIALGSSTQIALLVAPVLVLAGLLLGQPMDLVFTTFEVAAVGLTVIVTAIVTLDGESNWFEGVQLLAMYALVAAMAFFV
jgi:Ca2+:H+ antiporter